MGNPNGFEYWRAGRAPRALAGALAAPTAGSMEYWRGVATLAVIAAATPEDGGAAGLAARAYAYFFG